MNRFKMKFISALAVLFTAVSAFAGSVDYLSNQSARYFMSTSREAATDSADIVVYNPAGTAFLKEGLHINVSSQTFLKYYKNEDVNISAMSFAESYETTQPSLVVPSAYAAYNFGQIGSGKLAVFGGVGVPAGGGTVKWDGTAGVVGLAAKMASTIGSTLITKTDVDLEAYSVYYGITAGAAYSLLNDMISVSAGVRYVYADRWGKAKGTINFNSPTHGGLWTATVDKDYEYNAQGFTPIIGFDVRPLQGLTLGFRYEMETELEFEYSESKNELTNTGGDGTVTAVVAGTKAQLDYSDKKEDRNLPHMFAFAAEYLVTPELAISAGARIWLMSKADMDGEEDHYGTAYELSLGATYKIISPLKIGATVMYTDQGAKDSLLESSDYLFTTSANPVLNSWTFGLGAVYSINENLDITGAFAWTHYIPQTFQQSAMEYTYSKEVYTICIGIDYRM